MGVIRRFLSRVKSTGVRRAGCVRTRAMGIERTFVAYDIGNDTFVFERGISRKLNGRPSVLVVDKARLRKRGHGFVFTLTSGNHAVAAFPLLEGRFWNLSNIPSERRGDVLMTSILCSNIVNDTIEVSKRDVAISDLLRYDRWLRETVGFTLKDIVIAERESATLEHFRHLGQEWRIKPLAWTENEMRVALNAARKKISSKLTYFHSARGVHLLTYPEFKRFCDLARTDPEAFIVGLRELVSVYEGNRTSFTRMPKYRGYHEIEFFGMKRGQALERIVPEIERLMEAVVLGRLGQLGVIQRTQEIVRLYETLLTRPEYADETSLAFVETVYMHVTGEVYLLVSEGETPAFDDRRTALPGATFIDGRLSMHPGADARTEILLSNLRGMLSKDEIIEYANVYELRTENEVPLGKGRTREVVYKTNIRPLESSLIEKRLSLSRKGYSSYMLARIGALRAMGVGLSTYYRMLRQRAKTTGRDTDFYVRKRCEGEPLSAIPANYFRDMEGSSSENREFVCALAVLMGDAAAQNMAMKKYDPKTESPLFGVGKEIYECEYDIRREAIVPTHVTTCSIRGSFGWPDLEYSDENLAAIAGFYCTYYAHALREYAAQHTVPLNELIEHFWSGFEFRTHAMAWQLSVMRDKFEIFRPKILSRYGFDRKWKFVMWSLERQERRLPLLRKFFMDKIKVLQK